MDFLTRPRCTPWPGAILRSNPDKPPFDLVILTDNGKYPRALDTRGSIGQADVSVLIRPRRTIAQLSVVEAESWGGRLLNPRCRIVSACLKSGLEERIVEAKVAKYWKECELGAKCFLVEISQHGLPKQCEHRLFVFGETCETTAI